MKVVTVAAPKGGSCKTSTVCLLAVRAVQDAKRVCLLDLNADQASLTRWHMARGKPNNPHLELDIESISKDVRAIHASNQFDWLFIDTPPLDMDVIEAAVFVADCVVIPVRTSSLDVNSIDAIVEMCEERRKPYKFLLSAVDSKFKKLTQSAADALLVDGEIFGQSISYRLPYINAMTAGRTGAEIDGDLQNEATALWSQVQELAVSSFRPHPTRWLKGRVAANE